ncbi:MAG: hypothetical protein AAGD01_17085 [Acidobacteriota bacterium]
MTTAPAAFAQPPWDVDFPAEPEPSDDIGSIFSTANYSCNINISPFSSEDCSLEDVVDPQPSPFGSNQRRAIVDLNQGFNWRSLVVRVETCNPTGWTVHIGDSPTNNGYGGDSGSTSHDAEVQALNNQLTVYESDIGTSSLTCLFTGPPNPPGCIVQQYLVRNDYFEFDPNVPLTTNPLSICSNSTIFDFPNYDEADLEDPSGLYEDKVYVGLNRTYGSSSRNGSGIQRACFFLSTSATPNNSTITSECGF